LLQHNCGSSGYKAPEIEKSETVPYSGIKADVWSLGCILMELLLPHFDVTETGDGATCNRAIEVWGWQCNWYSTVSTEEDYSNCRVETSFGDCEENCWHNAET
jgi:serine/threonine protein kinase